ncbi:ion transporter [Fodinibius sediminis]|uniref:Voltage-gated potassium channel n=1 Tax=Fodinibius sediminis TaxID=1214077 RepID=A0A521BXW4_9BACT|nr:ion transporter [Fodinibius sediminis]SMO51411.1 voltage-gated potassium channel [Fodinibius sediminis]
MGREQPAGLRHRIHEIIFEADTRAGKTFDLVLLVSIVASVVVVMLDSIASFRSAYGDWFYGIEWFFTILFTIEYAMRIYSVQKASGYIFSFFGLVDLLSIVPTYISILLPGSQYFLVIRVLRVLRVFRVLKFTQYLIEVDQLRRALAASRRKITVFIFTVVSITVIVGALMYVIEGAENGFTSIPTGMYWAIVTLTTVGYGDISPQTHLGQMLSAVIMILGYGIIAVPTGIVTAELTRTKPHKHTTEVCPYCSREGHDADAEYCKYCGGPLNP